MGDPLPDWATDPVADLIRADPALEPFRADLLGVVQTVIPLLNTLQTGRFHGTIPARMVYDLPWAIGVLVARLVRSRFA